MKLKTPRKSLSASAGRRHKTQRLPPRLAVRPKAQEDGHTCGACAMYAVMRYHQAGLSFADVRGILGTDHSLTLFPGRRHLERLFEDRLEGLLGTLPVDIFFSLWACGFTSRVLPAGDQAFRLDLQMEIAEGRPLIAMIDTVYGPHWVVISGITPKGLWIADSLEPDRPVLWRQNRVRENLIGALAVLPEEDLLVNAMFRCLPFHGRVVKHYGRVGLRKLNGGAMAIPA